MIHLYEDAHHQLYLRRDDALNVHLVVGWHNGDFQKDAKQLDSQDKLDLDMSIVPFDADAMSMPVATWYAPGVFTAEPERLQPGSTARNYIGPFLVDAGRFMDAQLEARNPFGSLSNDDETDYDLEDEDGL